MGRRGLLPHSSQSVASLSLISLSATALATHLNRQFSTRRLRKAAAQSRLYGPGANRYMKGSYYARERQDRAERSQHGARKKNMNRSHGATRRGQMQQDQSSEGTKETDETDDIYSEDRQEIAERMQRKADKMNMAAWKRNTKRSSSANRRGRSGQTGMGAIHVDEMNGMNRTDRVQHRVGNRKMNMVASGRGMTRSSSAIRRGRYGQPEMDIGEMDGMDYPEERQDIPNRMQRRAGDRSTNNVVSDRARKRSTSANRRGRARTRADIDDSINDMDSEDRQDVTAGMQGRVIGKSLNSVASSRITNRSSSANRRGRGRTRMDMDGAGNDMEYAEERQDVIDRRSRKHSSSLKRRAQSGRLRTDEVEETQVIPNRMQRRASEKQMNGVTSDRIKARSSSANRRGRDRTRVGTNNEENIQRGANKRITRSSSTKRSSSKKKASTTKRRMQSGLSRVDIPDSDTLDDAHFY